MWSKAFTRCRKCKTKWAWEVWGTRYLHCPNCGRKMDLNQETNGFSCKGGAT